MSHPRSFVDRAFHCSFNAHSSHPLQFGKYLDENKRTVWSTQYVNYKDLKDLIKEAAATAELVGVGVSWLNFLSVGWL